MSGYIEVCYNEKIACPIKFNYKWTGLSEFYTLYENIYHIKGENKQRFSIMVNLIRRT
jgi:hypothetical protein